MERKTVALLLLAVFLLGVGLALTAYYGFYLLEYRQVRVEFNVTRGVGGLNGDTDALHLGTIPLGGSGARSMTVTSAHDARLVVAFSGNASPFLRVVPDDLAVERGVPVRLNFTATVPENATSGHYEGEARFYFYRR